MSGEEMKEQKMRLRIDLEESETHLAALREKARQHGDVLIQIGEFLKVSPEYKVFVHGPSIMGGVDAADIKPMTTTQKGSLDLVAMLSVANEIRTEIGKIADLRTRLASLG